MVIPYLIAAVVIISIFAFLLFVPNKRHSEISEKKPARSKKSQAQIIKQANRHLAKNPNDAAALKALGDLYFTSNLWEKAFPIYSQLSKISKTDIDVDSYKAFLRTGICALELDKMDEAMISLSLAYQKNPHDFDSNYFMGYALVKAKQYDKAVPCLKKALIVRPDATGVNLLLGQSYYNSHHYHDSLPCFKKALIEDPANKDALYCMADAMSQEGHGDKSIKVFMHLRADPVYGPRSCLQAGIYHLSLGEFDNAITDLIIGLKHENAEDDIKVEIRYKLAQAYFAKNQLSNGLIQLKEIRLMNSNYKDVNALIARYQELSQNSNLQLYLTAGTGDFVSLCRKAIQVYYKDAQLKFMDINMGQVFTDFVLEVNSPKFSDSEIFRFFRTTGSTGELFIRDFHGHLHDTKADRGICVTAGDFTEEARRYIEGRPLDLIEKNQLTALLKQVSV